MVTGDADFMLKRDLDKAIQLANQVIQSAGEAQSWRQECGAIKSKSERLVNLLQAVGRAVDLYNRPARRILADVEHVLEKALALVVRCSSSGLFVRLFSGDGAGTFNATSIDLKNSVSNVSWLLSISNAGNYDEEGDGEGPLHHGIPPIARSHLSLSLVWSEIAILRRGSLRARSVSANTLAELVCENHRYAKLVIQEDGVDPLLRLISDGEAEAQEDAVRTIRYLGQDADSVDRLVQAGVCSAFAQALKGGHMKLRAAVAHAISELVSRYPRCQDLFAQNRVTLLLVRDLAPEDRATELADASTKSYMKTMATMALWRLAKGNASICKSVTDTNALDYFAKLMEDGEAEVRRNAALAVMEIARMAEHDSILLRSAFKPYKATAKAVLDQLLRVVERAEPEDPLLATCITALGCLAKTFRATENRTIGVLVRLLENAEEEVTREAAVALTKFACPDTSLHVDHSKAIVDAGGVGHLVQLVYFGRRAQVEALVLLCYISLHTPLPDSKELLKAEVPAVLGWASNQARLADEPRVDSLLPEAREKFILLRVSP